MKLLSKPLFVVLAGTLASAGAGVFAFQQAAAGILIAERERRVAVVEATRPPEPWDFWTVELENLSRELQARLAQVDARAAELDRRDQILSAGRAELETTRRQVEAMRDEISRRIVTVEAQEARNLRSLAQTYALLSPGAAVAIFDGLDDGTVTKLLSLMKPESASAILEEFSRGGGPSDQRLKRAAEISQRLRLLVPASSS